ncbi:MAG: DNA repair protein RecO [Gammaproteobacteria bacterium]|nr:DNA repair protein RecO [Gammaproteobacteria bacterium]
MTTQLQPGVVIHTRAYGDTSLLVELFTREQGRLGAIARGARAARSRMRPLLQPFQPLLLSWRGRGELKTVTEIEATGAPWGLRGDALLSGYYLNELIMRLLPREDPAAAVYGHYVSAIKQLENGTPIEPVMRVFEKRLLDELGVGLVLDRDTTGSPLQSGQLYRYQPESGPGLSQEHGLKISGEALMALQAESLESPEILAEAKGLMRWVLRQHLGERPLRSRAIWRDLKRSAGP